MLSCSHTNQILLFIYTYKLLDDDWFANTYVFAERVSQITLTLCSDFSIYGFLPDLTCELFDHLIELLTNEEYQLSDTIFETIVTIAFRTMYHAYHSRRDDEDIHTACEKIVPLLIEKVPLEMYVFDICIIALKFKVASLLVRRNIFIFYH